MQEIRAGLFNPISVTLVVAQAMFDFNHNLDALDVRPGLKSIIFTIPNTDYVLLFLSFPKAVSHHRGAIEPCSKQH